MKFSILSNPSISAEKYDNNERWLRCLRTQIVRTLKRSSEDRRKTWHVIREQARGRDIKGSKGSGSGVVATRMAVVRRRDETRWSEARRGTTMVTMVACWSRAGGGAKLHCSACHPQPHNPAILCSATIPPVRFHVGYWFPRVGTPTGC